MRSIAKIYLPLIVLKLSSISCSRSEPSESRLAEAWDEMNDPERFGVFAGVSFQSIPSAARLTELPWSDDYWATYRGGISNRWQQDIRSKDYRAYLYELPTPSWINAATSAQIDQLSPAEKYDIARGNLSLPLAQHERSRMMGSIRNGEIPTWFGLCHGWAAASISEPEPMMGIAVKNPQGKEVVLYPSDLRALLTKAYADASLKNQFIGRRCNIDSEQGSNTRPQTTECRDSNAGAFHLVIADFIAERKQPFIVDVVPTAEVWNQPIYGYRFVYENFRPITGADPLKQYRAPGTKNLVDVRLTLEYARERSPSWAMHRTEGATQEYLYSLELDDEGRILGGEWTSGVRPDFLWYFGEKPEGTVSGIDLAWVRKLIEYTRSSTPPAPSPTNPPGGQPPSEPNPSASLVINGVTVHYRGTSVSAQVWASILAPAGSRLVTSVVYGNQASPAHHQSIGNSQRISYSFGFSRQGATSFYFELYGPDGRILASASRPIP